MDHTSILFAFGLTLFAGLSTGIGSAIAFFAKETNRKLLSIALGFSAGVMIYISFVEIFAESQRFLVGAMGPSLGSFIAIIAFFGGMFLTMLIDKFVPECENPHELRNVEEIKGCRTHDGKEKNKCWRGTWTKSKAMMCRRLYRVGIFSAMAIAIHNFPEGIATFLIALNDVHLGISLAIAIAIHNIPEGIAVSVPIFYATGSRKKAFLYSFLSGLSEPVGAIVGYLILMPFLNDFVFGVIFAGVAGIMIFIALDSLLPAAREYGEHHHAIFGTVMGMMVMAVSLVLLL